MSSYIKCLVIDDEPAAQKVLESYIADTPGLILSHISNDALDALDYLKEHSVDMMFLDVHMPRLSGISFLKSLNNPPLVILTTAYDDFALKGYELNVLDYLLKPFSFERFLQAVSKADNRITASEKSKTINVKSDGKIYRVDTNEILYIESMGDYVAIHLTDRKLIVYETLKSLEQELPADKFIRAHKSYIVAVSRVEYLEGNMLKIREQKIPVGDTFKDNVRSYFTA